MAEAEIEVVLEPLGGTGVAMKSTALMVMGGPAAMVGVTVAVSLEVDSLLAGCTVEEEADAEREGAVRVQVATTVASNEDSGSAHSSKLRHLCRSEQVRLSRRRYHPQFVFRTLAVCRSQIDAWRHPSLTPVYCRPPLAACWITD